MIETVAPIKRAARQYGIPHNTLRDRVKSWVDPNTQMTEAGPLLTQEEEAKLVKHIKYMADLGYCFTITEVVFKATDYAIHLGKRTADKPLSVKWFKGFKRRWPEMRVVKQRSLAQCRARCTSDEAISSYFNNLEEVLKSNGLDDKPECIFNIDEKGIQTEHSPPYVVVSECPCHHIVPIRNHYYHRWGQCTGDTDPTILSISLFSKVCFKLQNPFN